MNNLVTKLQANSLTAPAFAECIEAETELNSGPVHPSHVAFNALFDFLRAYPKPSTADVVATMVTHAELTYEYVDNMDADYWFLDVEVW